MQFMSKQEIFTERWWAATDMPVRTVSHAAFLIDGRLTMLEMCIRFLSARQKIYITAWGLTPEMCLVRGKHNRAGPSGSPEQKKLLAWLRMKGLAEADLLFWQGCDEMTVARVLSYAVSKGVDVRVLLWNTYTLPFQASPKQVRDTLEPLGIRCLLDDSHMGLLNHPLVAHHQKTVVVDGRYAFVGGIDMMIQNDGDYDRWDTKGHPFHSLLRVDKDGNMPHSWHDVHCMFEGPAITDVERNFRQRWNGLVNLHEMDPLLILPDLDPPPTANTALPIRRDADSTPLIQVTRTIPRGTYRFASQEGIATVLETYEKAFTQAQRFIYIENQYLWRRTFLGIENPVLGVPHSDMEHVLQLLSDALARGVVVLLLLPDNPNVGREFTDEGLKYLWEQAPQAVEQGRLQAYTLGSSLRQGEHVLYRSIYVHSKVAIVDDAWITLGSANLNNRGMRDDTEMNVALMQPEIAQALRILLMTEHLGVCDEDSLFQIIEAMTHAQHSSEAGSFKHFLRTWLLPRLRLRPGAPSLYAAHMTGELGDLWVRLQSLLGDPLNGMMLFAKQAKENLLAIKSSQPLTGHLLPYIPYERSADYGINVDVVNGWLDLIPDA